MKEYTTPTVTLTLEDGEDLLASAKTVVVTLKGARLTKDFTPEIVTRKIPLENGMTHFVRDTLSFKLTQAETAEFQGNVEVEATIKDRFGSVAKTETTKLFIKQALRREEM